MPAVMEASIQTASGRIVFPLALKPGDVVVEDIGHALSMQCRFSGHTRWHYSVAQHSLLVSDLVMRATGDAEQALWGLVHDASEAYLVDLPRPLKRGTRLGEIYTEVEAQVSGVIMEALGVHGPEPEAVRVADRVMLRVEKDVLMTAERRS